METTKFQKTIDLKISKTSPYLVGFQSRQIMIIWTMLYHHANVLCLVFTILLHFTFAHCEGVVKKLKQNSHEFLNILFAGIPENRRCSYEKVLFLRKVSDLDGEDDVLVTPDTLKNHEGLTLKSFVASVAPTVIIKRENVCDLPVEDFDKITCEIETMSRIMEEKDEAWKEERRFYEEQRMKEEIENQRKEKELLNEIEKMKAEIEANGSTQNNSIEK